jgi:hypothetical protein
MEPEPPLSFELNKLLFAIVREHRQADRLSDDDIAAYHLSAEEAEAVKSGDAQALCRLGANPHLIRRVFRSRVAR